LNVYNQLIDENGNVLQQLEPSSDDEYLETDTKDAAHILTELERQIKQSNAWTAARMVKKVNKKMKIFANNSIVSLAIPFKLQLKSEAKRLLC
jgi:pyruvate dehydrogenase complex dehydrogenase (E1) component